MQSPRFWEIGAMQAAKTTDGHPRLASSYSTSPHLCSCRHGALVAIEAAYPAARNQLLVELPTGTGTTIILAELIHRRGGRALVLVHTGDASDPIEVVLAQRERSV